MKEQWSISKDKLVSIEDGLICNEETPRIRPTVQTDTCKKLIQCIKFILYLELLLFVGWGCYAIWQTYRVESIEVRVTDSIQESEPRNLHDQRLHLEESPTTTNEFLTQMENLLQAENALSKTVDALQKQLDEERINTASKDPNSRLQNSRESGVELKSSPLSEINVPEMIVVDLGKDIENEEPKVSPNLSKSEENVLEWTFGNGFFVLFPGAFNIKERAQIAENDGSEQSKIPENLPENENEEMIDSAEADRIIEEIAKVLRDAKSAELTEDVATAYQRLSPDDLSKMGIPTPLNVMLTPPAVFVNPDIDTDVNSDDANVDPTVDQDTNGKGLVHIVVNHPEPNPEFQDDFAHENPIGEYVDSPVDESALLDATTDEGQEDTILFPADFVNNPEDDSQVDQPSWTSDEEFVLLEPKFYRDSGIINKRSISDAPVKEQHLWNKRVDDNLNKPKEEVIYNRVSNEGPSLNTQTNRRATSLLDSYIRGEENLLAQEIATVPNHEQQLIKNDLTNFFHKMEILASHIDKLHERYLYFHELNDDYISEEFPSDDLPK
ncbi:uncharacterized protein LOC100881141 isoform X1 [Megachile rotundata]|uniref:uncharacterized protein LOC100881141 isoform X1 n=1 Tax=Megachile rotundata TaxID=143995 RepID=UPI003FD585E7